LDKQLLKETLISIADSHALLRKHGVIRSKVMVGDLGEYYCEDLGFITKDDNKVKRGYDGLDKYGKRVQVKTRTSPNNRAKLSFKNLEFDYCLYVELNNNYQLVSISKVDKSIIETNLNKAKDGISVGNLKKSNPEVVYNS